MARLFDRFLGWLPGRQAGSDFSPPAGRVRFGDLRRVTPISRAFGFERGQPVDRYYIEQFLSSHGRDICGRVLEIGDNGYTRQFGQERVTQSDVLDLVADNPNATIVADLARCDFYSEGSPAAAALPPLGVGRPGKGYVPSDAFDCIIFTQTLQFIYDLQGATRSLHRMLKPGGVLLATYPVLSQICRYDMDRWGDYWRFTNASVQRLLADAFDQENVTIQAYGNVLAAVSFLHGLSAHELEPHELDYHDPDYQILITARAVK